MSVLLLVYFCDLESKADEKDEDKNRETRSERHKRVSRARNETFHQVKLIMSLDIFH